MCAWIASVEVRECNGAIVISEVRTELSLKPKNRITFRLLLLRVICASRDRVTKHCRGQVSYNIPGSVDQAEQSLTICMSGTLEVKCGEFTVM